MTGSSVQSRPPAQVKRATTRGRTFWYSGQMTEGEKRMQELEAMMSAPDFWLDKGEAQARVAEYQALKEGGGEEGHDGGPATLAVLAGAGGDDAEDFTRMLLAMYRGYAEKRGWGVKLLDDNENDNGGYRSALLEINGAGVYGRLKHEAGVHPGAVYLEECTP